MRKFLKVTGVIALLAGMWWYGGAAIDAVWLPPMPTTGALHGPSPATLESQVKLVQDRARELVDTQWSRDGSVPTDDDKIAFMHYINIADFLATAELRQELRKNDAALKEANAIADKWLNSYMRNFDALETLVGNTAAGAIITLTIRPRMLSSSYRAQYLTHRQFVLGSPRILASRLRQHFAMALVLAGVNAGAIEQLKEVMTTDPAYALGTETYIIGSRAGALDDPDFCALLQKIGGDCANFGRHFAADKPAMLHPDMSMIPPYKHVADFPRR